MQPTQDQHRATTHKNSTPGSRLLEITREFEAPLAKLFEAFTNEESLKAWWWPNGLYADRVDLDFRDGGRYFFNMKGYDKGGGGMCGEFEEIVPGRRIVMTDSFADENGRAISPVEAKMPGKWPETIYITLEFEAITPTSSRLHLAQEGIPNEMQADCIKGWNESFDKLERHLKPGH